MSDANRYIKIKMHYAYVHKLAIHNQLPVGQVFRESHFQQSVQIPPRHVVKVQRHNVRVIVQVRIHQQHTEKQRQTNYWKNSSSIMAYTKLM